jgi:hypothetical protein
VSEELDSEVLGEGRSSWRGLHILNLR